MEIKITDNVTDKDINEIYQELKKFNLSKMDPSEEIPL